LQVVAYLEWRRPLSASPSLDNSLFLFSLFVVVVIISSFSGSLRFVNVKTYEVVRVKTKHPIIKMDLMIESGKSFKV